MYANVMQQTEEYPMRATRRRREEKVRATKSCFTPSCRVIEICIQQRTDLSFFLVFTKEKKSVVAYSATIVAQPFTAKSRLSNAVVSKGCFNFSCKLDNKK